MCLNSKKAKSQIEIYLKMTMKCIGGPRGVDGMGWGAHRVVLIGPNAVFIMTRDQNKNFNDF
jgi:hypothetical protein